MLSFIAFTVKAGAVVAPSAPLRSQVSRQVSVAAKWNGHFPSWLYQAAWFFLMMISCCSIHQSFNQKTEVGSFAADSWPVTFLI